MTAPSITPSSAPPLKHCRVPGKEVDSGKNEQCCLRRKLHSHYVGPRFPFVFLLFKGAEMLRKVPEEPVKEACTHLFTPSSLVS